MWSGFAWLSGTWFRSRGPKIVVQAAPESPRLVTVKPPRESTHEAGTSFLQIIRPIGSESLGAAAAIEIALQPGGVVDQLLADVRRQLVSRLRLAASAGPVPVIAVTAAERLLLRRDEHGNWCPTTEWIVTSRGESPAEVIPPAAR